MEKENTNIVKIVLIAVVVITFLQSIRVLFFPVSPISRIAEWVIPAIGFLVIPLIWIKSKGLSKDILGLVPKWLKIKYVVIALLSGAAGFLPMINHQLIKGEPIIFVLRPEVLMIGIFLVLIYAPLRELFWRGFVQKRFEDVFRVKWHSILAVTLLAIIAEIPLFISYGKTPETIMMPLFNNLMQNLIFGFVFYKTKRLQVAMLGHSIYNLGFVIAHTSEISEIIGAMG